MNSKPVLRKNEFSHNYSQIIFLIGLFIKQFYLLPSGSLQLGDIIMMLGIGIRIINKQLHRQNIDNTILMYFIIAISINSLYLIYYSERSFFLASAYLVFNALVIIFVRDNIEDIYFIKGLSLVTKVSLIFQMLWHFGGKGRYYNNTERYEGTFNDPNQFGFYVISCFFILWIANSVMEDKKRNCIVWGVITFYLITLSNSMGMFLALYVFAMVSVLIPFVSKNGETKKTIVIIIIFAGISLFLYRILTHSIEMLANLNNPIINRLVFKLTRATASSNNGNPILGFFTDRKMNRVIIQPYYFVFGSGDGNNPAIIRVSNEAGDIHSTVIGLAYYYGILPYFLFLRWVKNNIKCLKIDILGVIIALAIESITLINHRQPFFWIIIILASNSLYKKERKKYE